MTNSSGTLYLVATPVGNLEDITYRAVRLLSEVDVIFAEDTRVSRVLLQRYDITTPIYSYREASSRASLEHTVKDILTRLNAGESVAYISDAGTPGVSDPGNYLVSRVVAEGITVSPIPGASALPMIMSVSGMQLTKLLFVGFLPKKKGKQTLLAELKHLLEKELIDGVVFYESPERIEALLRHLSEWQLDLKLCIGRELTKKFEEVHHGNLEEMLQIFTSPAKQRGEFVVLVSIQDKVRED